jgi:hypothetical protein
MKDDTGQLPTVPLFDLVMGVPVPTLRTGAEEQRRALEAAQASEPPEES